MKQRAQAAFRTIRIAIGHLHYSRFQQCTRDSRAGRANVFLANAQDLLEPCGRIIPRMCFEAPSAPCPPIQEHNVIRSNLAIDGVEIQIRGSDLNVPFSVRAAGRLGKADKRLPGRFPLPTPESGI